MIANLILLVIFGSMLLGMGYVFYRRHKDGEPARRRRKFHIVEDDNGEDDVNRKQG